MVVLFREGLACILCGSRVKSSFQGASFLWFVDHLLTLATAQYNSCVVLLHSNGFISSALFCRPFPRFVVVVLCFVRPTVVL